MSEIRSAWHSAWQNRVSVTGAALAGLAILFFIAFLLMEIVAPTGNPYTGLWIFLVLPSALVLGLVLVPLGWLRQRRRLRKLAPEELGALPVFHLNLQDPRHRKGLTIFGLGTLAVIPLIAVSSYEGYHYTDSTQFCGQVCHSVMHPEYTSYLGSPHARVNCADCHIGPGADWFVKAKLSGVRQVFAVTFNTYSKPISTPVRNLRPARETCEQCHWPAKFFGSQLRHRVHFASDEKNTRTELRVLVKTGGADPAMGPVSGIHWHMALGNKIEYVATDSARQVIPWVRATDHAGRVAVYRSDGKGAQDSPPQGELRQVDCMDCHNRPTHIIYPPDKALNISLETGRMDRTLPYVKKAAGAALTEPYSTEEEADSKIGAFIHDFYQKLDPKMAEMRKSSIHQAVEETRAIYRRNFFPRMNVNWRVYPDNIGHMFFDGCFRCHDNRHVTEDRRTIRKDCSVCHEFQQPVGEAGQNTFRQGTIEHPVKLAGIHAELKCSSCHTGGRAPEPTCAGCHTSQVSFAQGRLPVLPDLKGTPSSMAGVDCDSCHDLAKPRAPETMAAQCEGCHEKGFGDMIQLWKDDVVAGRSKAAAALAEMRKTLEGRNGKNGESARQLMARMQAALEEVDRAGPLHNPEFAGAVYERIVKLTTGIGNHR